MHNRRPAGPRLTGRLFAAQLALLAAACAPDRAPTAPPGPLAPPLFSGDAFTGDPNELARLVTYLFVEDEAAALREVGVITGNDPGTDAACGGTAQLLDRTFRNYREYGLYGQVDARGLDLTFPLPAVQLLVRRLSLNCPRLAPANGVPSGALNPGGAAGVIRASDGGTVETIPTPQGQAGVRIRPGTFDQDVVLFIVPQPALRLPTTLAQSAPYYNVYVEPEQPRPYRFPVDLGFAVNWPNRPPSDHLVIGHDAPVSGMEVLQPICLTTPASAVGAWGGPLYLRPAAGCPAPVSAARGPAPSGFSAVIAAAVGTSTNHGGQAESLSPFGLVSIFQPGVNPNAGMTLGTTACTAAGRAIPYTVASANDLVVSYAEVDASGAALTARRLLYVRGTAAGGPAAGQVRVTNSATRRVRFFYGATLFRTVDATVAGCAG